jgi:hypothetical protein
MPEEPYKNREIKEMFDDLKKGNERIETQVIKTNGRVTRLEQWKYIGMGATSVLTIIVVPILSWALYILVNIQGQVHSAVDQALSAYDIEK